MGSNRKTLGLGWFVDELSRRLAAQIASGYRDHVIPELEAYIDHKIAGIEERLVAEDG